MYVHIKVANGDDARMVRDMLVVSSSDWSSFVTITKGEFESFGWWFVNTCTTIRTIEKILSWAARNEVKIFSIETSTGETFYEADS